MFSGTSMTGMKSYVSYGTGPIGTSELSEAPYMGPVLYLPQRHAWDQSHRSLKTQHGTPHLKVNIKVL